jgi:hypothetical protein
MASVAALKEKEGASSAFGSKNSYLVKIFFIKLQDLIRLCYVCQVKDFNAVAANSKAISGLNPDITGFLAVKLVLKTSLSLPNAQNFFTEILDNEY